MLSSRARAFAMSDTYSFLPMNISGADGCEGGGSSRWL
jgi:hypothetical protein